MTRLRLLRLAIRAAYEQGDRVSLWSLWCAVRRSEREFVSLLDNETEGGARG